MPFKPSGIGTVARGSFINCGPGVNTFQLEFKCSGPACSSLNGLQSVHCDHGPDSDSMSCSNDVQCPQGIASFSSNFTFQQNEPDPWNPMYQAEPDGGVQQQQHISLPNCAKYSLTSDGTKENTRIEDLGKNEATCPRVQETPTAGIRLALKTSSSALGRPFIGATIRPEPMRATSGLRKSVPKHSTFITFLLLLMILLPGALAGHNDHTEQVRRRARSRVRAISNNVKAFASDFSADLSARINAQGQNGEYFAHDLVAGVMTSVCNGHLGASKPENFTPAVIEACLKNVYGAGKLPRPADNFLSVFGASLLCDYIIGEAYPVAKEFFADGCEGLQDLTRKVVSNSPNTISNTVPSSNTQVTLSTSPTAVSQQHASANQVSDLRSSLASSFSRLTKSGGLFAEESLSTQPTRSLSHTVPSASVASESGQFSASNGQDTSRQPSNTDNNGELPDSSASSNHAFFTPVSGILQSATVSDSLVASSFSMSILSSPIGSSPRPSSTESSPVGSSFVEFSKAIADPTVPLSATSETAVSTSVRPVSTISVLVISKPVTPTEAAQTRTISPNLVRPTATSSTPETSSSIGPPSIQSSPQDVSSSRFLFNLGPTLSTGLSSVLSRAADDSTILRSSRIASSSSFSSTLTSKEASSSVFEISSVSEHTLSATPITSTMPTGPTEAPEPFASEQASPPLPSSTSIMSSDASSMSPMPQSLVASSMSFPLASNIKVTAESSEPSTSSSSVKTSGAMPGSISTPVDTLSNSSVPSTTSNIYTSSAKALGRPSERASTSSTGIDGGSKALTVATILPTPNLSVSRMTMDEESQSSAEHASSQMISTLAGTSAFMGQSSSTVGVEASTEVSVATSAARSESFDVASVVSSRVQSPGVTPNTPSPALPSDDNSPIDSPSATLSLMSFTKEIASLPVPEQASSMLSVTRTSHTSIARHSHSSTSTSTFSVSVSLIGLVLSFTSRELWPSASTTSDFTVASTTVLSTFITSVTPSEVRPAQFEFFSSSSSSLDFRTSIQPRTTSQAEGSNTSTTIQSTLTTSLQVSEVIHTVAESSTSAASSSPFTPQSYKPSSSSILRSPSQPTSTPNNTVTLGSPTTRPKCQNDVWEYDDVYNTCCPTGWGWNPKLGRCAPRSPSSLLGLLSIRQTSIISQIATTSTPTAVELFKSPVREPPSESSIVEIPSNVTSTESSTPTPFCNPTSSTPDLCPGGDCFNLANDTMHCGDCFSACSEEAICSNGQCLCPDTLRPPYMNGQCTCPSDWVLEKTYDQCCPPGHVWHPAGYCFAQPAGACPRGLYLEPAGVCCPPVLSKRGYLFPDDILGSCFCPDGRRIDPEKGCNGTSVAQISEALSNTSTVSSSQQTNVQLNTKTVVNSVERTLSALAPSSTIDVEPSAQTPRCQNDAWEYDNIYKKCCPSGMTWNPKLEMCVKKCPNGLHLTKDAQYCCPIVSEGQALPSNYMEVCRCPDGRPIDPLGDCTPLRTRVGPNVGLKSSGKSPSPSFTSSTTMGKPTVQSTSIPSTFISIPPSPPAPIPSPIPPITGVSTQSISKTTTVPPTQISTDISASAKGPTRTPVPAAQTGKTSRTRFTLSSILPSRTGNPDNVVGVVIIAYRNQSRPASEIAKGLAGWW